MSKENAFVLQEQNILALCVKNPHLIYEVDSKYLISKTAKAMYKGIKNLIESEVGITTRTIYTEVQKEITINSDLIDNLFQIEVKPKDFKGLYSSLRKQWAKNNIQDYLLEDMLTQVSQKGEVEVSQLLDLRSKLDDNIRIIDNDIRKVFTLSDMFEKYDIELNRRESGDFFYDSGCSYLNQHLSIGFAPQFITTIFGQSGVGKSTYALYLINKQINKQIPSIYFSPEMPLIATMDRLVAQRLKMPLDYLYPAKEEEVDGMGINEDIRELVNKEKRKLEHLQYFRFVEEESLFITDMESIIEQTKREMGVDYLVVTVDLLTMIKDFNVGNDSKANLYENAMNNLHEMVRRQNVHLVGVVQSRRPSGKVVVNTMDDIDKLRPGIEEIKNAAAIEERSRVVISTFRKDYFAQKYLPEEPETELLDPIMDVQILKQNMGKLSMLHYLFVGESAYMCKFIEEEI